MIPKNLEETYYNRFVAPLIASFDDVDVQGFEINRSNYDPHPLLTLSELHQGQSREVADLFDGSSSNSHEPETKDDEAGKIVFDLSFKYGKHRFRGDVFGPVSVTIEKKDN